MPPAGQRWATPAQLATAGHRSEIRELEPGALGIGVQPALGVGQRGVLVRGTAGNLLWDPPPFVDEAAMAAIAAAGGVRWLSASHPHMYGALAQLSERFGAPALLPAADASWLTRPEVAVERWSEVCELPGGLTLVQCGGHFPGSSVLHWSGGAQGRGALFTGDTMLVTPGGDRVTFVWSAPNRLPLPEAGVRGIVAALAPYRFERIYHGWWEPVVGTGAHTVLERSAARYIEFLRGTAP